VKVKSNAERKVDAAANSDRRRSQRYDISHPVQVRLIPDGTPIKGFATEMGPNGMRLQTTIPLIEASYVHVTFETASNNTYCEGRVVWTQSGKDTGFESGVDIQKWGGGTPGRDPLTDVSNARPKADRRSRYR
jgi:hypothetical protein